MRVLLLDPRDSLPRPFVGWDLVVDLCRAPSSTYELWSRQAGCEVVSLFRYAEEICALHRRRELLQTGVGQMVDSCGIDWWELLCLFIAEDLEQFLLVRRLAKDLPTNCELFSTRPHPLATALQTLLGARLTIAGNRVQLAMRKARSFCDAVAALDPDQLAQVLEDKFDGDHSIRRLFARRRMPSGSPVILLPSAYTNVSRTALAYAELLPDHQFLLVLTRSSGKVRSLPRNVRAASLTPYFAPKNQPEIASLLEGWNRLQALLVQSAEPFALADAAGVLDRVPALLPWGISLRDAWNQLFESENVTGCLSADDSNPPSSIPLILAKQRGLPAVGCHHGALDYRMASKTNHADCYLAKSEMEEDYLRRICRLAPEKIVAASPATSRELPPLRSSRSAAAWLVFFTEPYRGYGWRIEEVYRDLLPRLYSLARTTGLKLVFKLHPFESVKGHRKMLQRLIPEEERHIEVIAGPSREQLWSNARFALTVQSSTALECAARGIPVFLCAWLRDPFSGYVSQYARFGVGHVLESPEQLAEVPHLLEKQRTRIFQAGTSPITTGYVPRLADLFSGAHALSIASTA